MSGAAQLKKQKVHVGETVSALEKAMVCDGGVYQHSRRVSMH
jgi:hypothetical protein